MKKVYIERGDRMALEIDSGVTSQIMDLKTSTPGVTRKEEIKTGFKSVDDYTKYLQEKYDYLNKGTVSMQGVPTSISVSSAFLQKCKDDPEKAAFLEENLAAIPECMRRSVEYTKTMPESPVMTYAKIVFDDNGNITMMSGCTNDPDGKIARENARRKAAEEKAEKEKAEKRREEKKAEKERLERHQAKIADNSEKADEFIISATGRDIKSITAVLTEKISTGDTGGMVSFDAKA